MSIDIDSHSGFCAGVTRAIRMAEEELQTGSLCCLGDIVHNGQEVKRLEKSGLRTIGYGDLSAMRGGRVLLRAHGEPPSTYETADANGIEIIDASCPVVLNLQKKIRQTYLEHPEAQIVIFGKVGHAEVIGLQGQTDNTAIVVESIEDVGRIDPQCPIYFFSQTTKSEEEFEAIAAELSAFQRSGLTTYDTICRSVANRVTELIAFAKEHELVIFVGGKKSSNAKVLFEVCKQANPNTLFVSSADDLSASAVFQRSDLSGDADLTIGICGATSTPLWLMEQVRDKIQQHNGIRN